MVRFLSILLSILDALNKFLSSLFNFEWKKPIFMWRTKNPKLYSNILHKQYYNLRRKFDRETNIFLYIFHR